MLEVNKNNEKKKRGIWSLNVVLELWSVFYAPPSYAVSVGAWSNIESVEPEVYRALEDVNWVFRRTVQHLCTRCFEHWVVPDARWHTALDRKCFNRARMSRGGWVCLQNTEHRTARISRRDA